MTDTDRIEPMRTDTWPRRPSPPSQPPFDRRIHGPSDLHALRAELRHWVPRQLEGDDADAEVLDTLLLVVDELATNGLRHGSAPVTVTVVPTGCGLFLDVTDGDSRHGPEPAIDRDPALGGMGLAMVARVTTTRGWTTSGDRKHVWACIPVPSTSLTMSACG